MAVRPGSAMAPWSRLKLGDGPMDVARKQFVAVGLVMLTTVTAVWFWGRPESEPPMVGVAATTERWPTGQNPGEFVVVEVPASLAPWFVAPADLEGRVPVSDVPEETLVPAGLLRPRPVVSDPATTRIRLEVDASWWSEPGPRPGDMAVLSAQRGGCALAVLEVIDAVQTDDTDTEVVVEIEPGTAVRLGVESLSVWRAPGSGWPACPEDAGMKQEDH